MLELHLLSRFKGARAALFVLAFLFIHSGSSVADHDHDEAPSNIEGIETIDAESLIVKVQEIPELVLIDSRIQSNRKHGYIEGSISLPDVLTDCDTLSMHIPTKDTPALFYCNGVNCLRSSKAAVIARQCGYTRLYWFRGGFLEWKQKGYAFLKE